MLFNKLLEKVHLNIICKCRKSSLQQTFLQNSSAFQNIPLSSEIFSARFLCIIMIPNWLIGFWSKNSSTNFSSNYRQQRLKHYRDYILPSHTQHFTTSYNLLNIGDIIMKLCNWCEGNMGIYINAGDISHLKRKRICTGELVITIFRCRS